MTLIMTLLTDVALFFGAFTSVFVATCYGELCGIVPGRDKSGLGGFAFVFLFLLMRWLCIAGGLAVAHHRDALPAQLVGQGWVLFGSHALLGVISAVVFNRGVDRVQADKTVPAWFGFAIGVLLPLPALTIAILGVNASWLGSDAVAICVVVGTLFAAHALPFRSRLADMRRTAARLAAAAAAAPAEGPPGDSPV